MWQLHPSVQELIVAKGFDAAWYRQYALLVEERLKIGLVADTSYPNDARVQDITLKIIDCHDGLFDDTKTSPEYMQTNRQNLKAALGLGLTPDAYDEILFLARLLFMVDGSSLTPDEMKSFSDLFSRVDNMCCRIQERAVESDNKSQRPGNGLDIG